MPEDGIDTVESEVVRMARTGELGDGAREAVRRQLAKGIPVTFLRGTQIIQLHPNGREVVLGEVPPAVYDLPAGVEIMGT